MEDIDCLVCLSSICSAAGKSESEDQMFLTVSRFDIIEYFWEALVFLSFERPKSFKSFSKRKCPSHYCTLHLWILLQLFFHMPSNPMKRRSPWLAEAFMHPDNVSVFVLRSLSNAGCFFSFAFECRPTKQNKGTKVWNSPLEICQETLMKELQKTAKDFFFVSHFKLA